MNLSIIEDDEEETQTERPVPTQPQSAGPTEVLSPGDRSLHQARPDTSGKPEEQPSDDALPVHSSESAASDEPPETLNQTELARLFNMSRNLVIDRIEEAGIVPVQRGGRTGTRYLVTPELTELLSHKYNGTDRKLEATERKLEAEAELKEIQVLERRGELISVSEIELGSVQFFRTLYNSFMTYFADSALEISRLRTRGEVEHYQKEHGGKLLQNLREDPNNALTRYNDQSEVSND